VERHLEIEAKFDVGEEFHLPDLAALPEVAEVQPLRLQRLVATYFDTDDLRLLRSSATLRRRTGGSDAGWHLKLPAGAQRRLELRRPPGRPADGVPEELIGLTRARTRAAELGPVARLTTRRKVHRLLDAEGTVLAEIADDGVTAETMGEAVTTSTWREVEVELVDGTPELLAAATKALRRAGAKAAGKESKLARALSDRLEATGPSRPGAPAGKRPRAGDVALAHVREQVEELQSRDPDVRTEADDAVHKMRVATRRLRSALATFRPLFDREVTDPLRDELKWLGGVLGEARDAEVMHERLTGELESLPAELVLGPVAKRLEDELRTTYTEAFADVLVELDGERYLSLLGRLADLLADPPLSEVATKKAEKVLERRVQHSLRRVQRAAVAADEAPDAEQRDLRMHEVRKAAKRARYAGESVSSVFGKRATKFAAGMESIQEILGAHQDSIVAQRVLLDLGARAHLDGDNTFTYGVLVGLQRCSADATAADYAKVWATVKAAGKKWPG
jgi:CHAD domain-containing protein